MKLTLICHSDSRGGAAVVTLRLMQALREAGHDARMLVVHKDSDSPWVQAVRPKWRAKACFLAEHLRIFAANGLSRKRLFLASIANCGMPLASHPWVKEADGVVLAWVNQGMISLSEIARIKAPVAWIMHDMWNAVGVCHYAGECQRFHTLCGSCPVLSAKPRTDFHADLSTATWRRKQVLYAAKDIIFVAVSTWLKDICRQSPLMQGQMVEVIPNALPVEKFYTAPRLSRCHMGLPEAKRLIVMGAARLDVPIKGLPLAIEALNHLADSGCQDVAAVFFGDLRDPDALNSLRMPYAYLGPTTDQERIREIYAHADVVLSAAHYENLPTTLIEGMAAGCVPVTFGQGGQADIVDHLRTGYIARFPDTADLAAGIRWALATHLNQSTLSTPLTREALHATTLRYSAPAIASRIAALFT